MSWPTANTAATVARTEPMRLLLLNMNPVAHGGTYWRARYLGEALARRGHSVTRMVTAPTARWRMREHVLNGVRVLETPDWLPRRHYGWDLWNAMRRSVWTARQRYDVVYAFETRPVVLAPAWVAQRRGATLVFDWCDWLGRSGDAGDQPKGLRARSRAALDTFFEDSFRGWAAGTTVIGTSMYERAVRLGVRPERLLMLRNGCVPPGRAISSKEARRVAGLPDRSVLIGHLGRVVRNDARFMAQAFSKLLNLLPNAKLVLIGFNHDIADQLTAPGAAITIPAVPLAEVHTFLAACDVCWIPLQDSAANRLRVPLKFNDYLTAGKAVVATNVGDTKDIIAEYGCGVVTNPDPDAVANATAKLILDPARLAALGDAARHGASRSSWERAAEKLDAFFLSVRAPHGLAYCSRECGNEGDSS